MMRILLYTLIIFNIQVGSTVHADSRSRRLPKMDHADSLPDRLRTHITSISENTNGKKNLERIAGQPSKRQKIQSARESKDVRNRSVGSEVRQMPFAMMPRVVGKLPVETDELSQSGRVADSCRLRSSLPLCEIKPATKLVQGIYNPGMILESTWNFEGDQRAHNLRTAGSTLESFFSLSVKREQNMAGQNVLKVSLSLSKFLPETPQDSNLNLTPVDIESAGLLDSRRSSLMKHVDPGMNSRDASLGSLIRNRSSSKYKSPNRSEMSTEGFSIDLRGSARQEFVIQDESIDNTVGTFVEEVAPRRYSDIYELPKIKSRINWNKLCDNEELTKHNLELIASNHNLRSDDRMKAYVYLGDLEEKKWTILKNYEEALNISEGCDDTQVFSARVILKIAQIKKNNSESIRELQGALELLKKGKECELKAQIYICLAQHQDDNKSQSHHLKKAKYYLSKATEKKEGSEKNNHLKAEVWIALAELAIDADERKQYYSEVEKLFDEPNLEHVAFNYHSSLRCISTVEEVLKAKVSLGSVEFCTNDIERAACYNEAVVLLSKTTEHALLARAYLGLAKYCVHADIKQNHYKKVLSILDGSDQHFLIACTYIELAPLLDNDEMKARYYNIGLNNLEKLDTQEDSKVKEIRASALIGLAELIDDSDIRVSYYQEARDLSIVTEQPVMLMLAQIGLAELQVDKSGHQSIYEEAIGLLDDNQYSVWVARAQIGLANILQDADRQKSLYDKALRLLSNTNDRILIAKATIGLADINQSESERNILYKKAKNLLKETAESGMQAHIYRQIGLLAHGDSRVKYLERSQSLLSATDSVAIEEKIAQAQGYFDLGKTDGRNIEDRIGDHIKALSLLAGTYDKILQAKINAHLAFLYADTEKKVEHFLLASQFLHGTDEYLLKARLMVEMADIIDDDITKREHYLSAIALFDSLDKKEQIVQKICRRALLGAAKLEEDLDAKQEYLEQARYITGGANTILEAQICMEYGRCLQLKEKRSFVAGRKSSVIERSQKLPKSYSTDNAKRGNVASFASPCSVVPERSRASIHCIPESARPPRSSNSGTPRNSNSGTPRNSNSSTPRVLNASLSRITSEVRVSPAMFFKRARSLAIKHNNTVIERESCLGLYDCGDRQNTDKSPQFWRKQADSLK